MTKLPKKIWFRILALILAVILPSTDILASVPHRGVEEQIPIQEAFAHRLQGQNQFNVRAIKLFDERYLGRHEKLTFPPHEQNAKQIQPKKTASNPASVRFAQSGAVGLGYGFGVTVFAKMEMPETAPKSKLDRAKAFFEQLNHVVWSLTDSDALVRAGNLEIIRRLILSKIIDKDLADRIDLISVITEGLKDEKTLLRLTSAETLDAMFVAGIAEVDSFSGRLPIDHLIQGLAGAPREIRAHSAKALAILKKHGLVSDADLRGKIPIDQLLNFSTTHFDTLAIRYLMEVGILVKKDFEGQKINLEYFFRNFNYGEESRVDHYVYRPGFYEEKEISPRLNAARVLHDFLSLGLVSIEELRTYKIPVDEIMMLTPASNMDRTRVGSKFLMNNAEAIRHLIEMKLMRKEDARKDSIFWRWLRAEFQKNMTYHPFSLYLLKAIRDLAAAGVLTDKLLAETELKELLKEYFQRRQAFSGDEGEVAVDILNQGVVRRAGISYDVKELFTDKYFSLNDSYRGVNADTVRALIKLGLLTREDLADKDFGLEHLVENLGSESLSIRVKAADALHLLIENDLADPRDVLGLTAGEITELYDSFDTLTDSDEQIAAVLTQHYLARLRSTPMQKWVIHHLSDVLKYDIKANGPLTKERITNDVIPAAERGDHPYFNRRSQEILASYRKRGPKKLKLTQLELKMAGNAENNFTALANELFDVLPLRNEEKLLGLPDRNAIGKEAERIKAPVVGVRGGKIQIGDNLLPVDSSFIPQGRTVIYSLGDRAVHLKFLKQGESVGNLLYEYDITSFLSEKQASDPDWNLKGSYPKGLLRLGKIRTSDVPANWLSGLKDKDGAFVLDEEGGYYTFMAYETNLADGKNSYATYLNDPDLSHDEFRRAFLTNIHDRFEMARHGLFDTEIIELYHDLGAAEPRRFDWMRGVNGSKMTHEAGDIEDVVGHTLYPNIRLSGPADLPNLRWIDDLMSEALPNHDGRLSRLIFSREIRHKAKARNYMEAAFAGDALLAFALIAATYLERRDELNYEEETGSKGTFLQELLREMFDVAYAAFNRADSPFQKFDLDIQSTTRQLAYHLTARYVNDLPRIRTIKSMFWNARIVYEEDPEKWTDHGWDTAKKVYEIPTRGSQKIFRHSHDAASSNAAVFYQGLIRALFIATPVIVAGELSKDSGFGAASPRFSKWPTWSKFVAGYFILGVTAFILFKMGLSDSAKHFGVWGNLAIVVVPATVVSVLTDVLGQWISGLRFKLRQTGQVTLLSLFVQIPFTWLGFYLLNIFIPPVPFSMPLLHILTAALRFIVMQTLYFVRTQMLFWITRAEDVRSASPPRGSSKPAGMGADGVEPHRRGAAGFGAEDAFDRLVQIGDLLSSGKYEEAAAGLEEVFDFSEIDFDTARKLFKTYLKEHFEHVEVWSHEDAIGRLNLFLRSSDHKRLMAQIPVIEEEIFGEAAGNLREISVVGLIRRGKEGMWEKHESEGIVSTLDFIQKPSNATIPASQMVSDELNKGTRLLLYPSFMVGWDTTKLNVLMAEHLLELVSKGGITDIAFELGYFRENQAEAAQTERKFLLELVERYKNREEVKSISDELHAQGFEVILNNNDAFIETLEFFLNYVRQHSKEKIIQNIQFHFPFSGSDELRQKSSVSEAAPELFEFANEMVQGNRKGIFIIDDQYAFKNKFRGEEGDSAAETFYQVFSRLNPLAKLRTKVYATVAGADLTAERNFLLEAAELIAPPVFTKSGFTMAVKVDVNEPFAKQQISSTTLNTFEDVDGVIVFRAFDEQGDDDDRNDGNDGPGGIPFQPEPSGSSEPNSLGPNEVSSPILVVAGTATGFGIAGNGSEEIKTRLDLSKNVHQVSWGGKKYHLAITPLEGLTDANKQKLDKIFGSRLPHGDYVMIGTLEEGPTMIGKMTHVGLDEIKYEPLRASLADSFKTIEAIDQSLTRPLEVMRGLKDSSNRVMEFVYIFARFPDRSNARDELRRRHQLVKNLLMSFYQEPIILVSLFSYDASLESELRIGMEPVAEQVFEVTISRDKKISGFGADWVDDRTKAISFVKRSLRGRVPSQKADKNLAAILRKEYKTRKGSKPDAVYEQLVKHMEAGSFDPVADRELLRRAMVMLNWMKQKIGGNGEEDETDFSFDMDEPVKIWTSKEMFEFKIEGDHGTVQRKAKRANDRWVVLEGEEVKIFPSDVEADLVPGRNKIKLRLRPGILASLSVKDLGSQSGTVVGWFFPVLEREESSESKKITLKSPAPLTVSDFLIPRENFFTVKVISGDSLFDFTIEDEQIFVQPHEHKHIFGGLNWVGKGEKIPIESGKEVKFGRDSSWADIAEPADAKLSRKAFTVRMDRVETKWKMTVTDLGSQTGSVVEWQGPVGFGAAAAQSAIAQSRAGFGAKTATRAAEFATSNGRFRALGGPGLIQSIRRTGDERMRRNLFDGYLKSFLFAIKMYDPITYGHTVRVAEMTLGLAHALDTESLFYYQHAPFTADELRQIYFVGMLHGVGKIGVRSEVLGKAKKLFPLQIEVIRHRLDTIQHLIETHSLHEFIRSSLHLKGGDQAFLEPAEIEALSIPRGTLTLAEREEIESHVVKSVEFMEFIPWPEELSDVIEIAGAHHEMLDGSGYPKKIRGDAIRLESRAVAIADIYDALTAKDRPYKKPLPHDKAIAILRDEANRGRIDGRLLDIFVEKNVYRIAETFSPDEEIKIPDFNQLVGRKFSGIGFGVSSRRGIIWAGGAGLGAFASSIAIHQGRLNQLPLQPKKFPLFQLPSYSPFGGRGGISNHPTRISINMANDNTSRRKGEYVLKKPDANPPPTATTDIAKNVDPILSLLYGSSTSGLLSMVDVQLIKWLRGLRGNGGSLAENEKIVNINMINSYNSEPSGFGAGETNQSFSGIFTRLLDQDGLVPAAVRYIDLFLRLAFFEGKRIPFEDETGFERLDLRSPDGKQIYFAAPGKPEKLILAIDYNIAGVAFRGNAQETEHPVIIEWERGNGNIRALYIALDKNERQYLKIEILKKSGNRPIEPLDIRSFIIEVMRRRSLALTPERIRELPLSDLVLRSSVVNAPLQTAGFGVAEEKAVEELRRHVEWKRADLLVDDFMKHGPQARGASLPIVVSYLSIRKNKEDFLANLPDRDVSQIIFNARYDEGLSVADARSKARPGTAQPQKMGSEARDRIIAYLFERASAWKATLSDFTDVIGQPMFEYVAGYDATADIHFYDAISRLEGVAGALAEDSTITIFAGDHRIRAAKNSIIENLEGIELKHGDSMLLYYGPAGFGAVEEVGKTAADLIRDVEEFDALKELNWKKWPTDRIISRPALLVIMPLNWSLMFILGIYLSKSWGWSFDAGLVFSLSLMTIGSALELAIITAKYIYAQNQQTRAVTRVLMSRFSKIEQRANELDGTERFTVYQALRKKYSDQLEDLLDFIKYTNEDFKIENNIFTDLIRLFLNGLKSAVLHFIFPSLYKSKNLFQEKIHHLDSKISNVAGPFSAPSVAGKSSAGFGVMNSSGFGAGLNQQSKTQNGLTFLIAGSPEKLKEVYNGITAARKSKKGLETFPELLEAPWRMVVISEEDPAFAESFARRLAQELKTPMENVHAGDWTLLSDEVIAGLLRREGFVYLGDEAAVSNLPPSIAESMHRGSIDFGERLVMLGKFAKWYKQLAAAA